MKCRCRIGYAVWLLVLATISVEVRAERRPDSPSDASIVVTGSVEKIFHRDTTEQHQYMVQIRIEKVEKGDNLKVGEWLPVYCFQRKADAPRRPAESGHKAVPTEGQRIRALAKSRRGILEGLYPDWFSVLNPEETIAKEPALPDFSKAMEDVSFVRKEKGKGEDAYYLKTKLSARDFAGSLRTRLGAGWRKRVLNKEDMALAAVRGRTLGAVVNLSAYTNVEFPEIEVLAFHLTYKNLDNGPNVEIIVVRPDSNE